MLVRSAKPFALLALTLVSGCDPASAFDPATVARFEAALEATQEEQASAGTLILVEDGSGRRWTGAAGHADLETETLATERTLFRSASVAKTFMGALVLSLHEEGRLSVDDPISDWVPRVPHGDAITLRMLLQHTSGIANYTQTPTYRDTLRTDRTHVFTADELVDMSIAMPPDFAPGEGWNYSNTGYILLGLVVEAIVGRSFGDECIARFFEPLGMLDTRPLSGGTVDGLWSSYVVGAEGPMPVVGTSGYAWDGGWVTSLHDMAIWARELLGGRLHDPETLALASESAGGALLDGIAANYGFESGGYALGHVVALDPELGPLDAGAGNGDGVRTFVGYFREPGVAFVVAVNVGEGAVPLIETLSAARPILGALRETYVTP